MTSEGVQAAGSTPKMLGVGAATGALSGLLGVGGGVVMVPALVALGRIRHRANAVSLATILIIALSGMIGFAVAGTVDFGVGVAMGLGGVAGATFGARWANRLSGVVLARIFGVLLLVTGARMLVGVEAASSGAGAQGVWALVGAALIGVSAGVISGLAGVGGGVIMVPAMVFLLGMGQHTAEGTSLLAIIFTAAAGTRVNHTNGHVEWRAVWPLAVGGAVLAPVAATLVQLVPADVLARVFAGWLLLIAVRTLAKSRNG